MIKINLLSPSDRLSAKWEKINHLVFSNFALLIIGQLVLAFIFFVSIEYLNAENRNLDKQLENMQVQADAKEVEEIKNDIKKYDKQLKNIIELRKSHYIFTDVLEDFSEIVPAGIKINSIDIKPKNFGIAKKIKGEDNNKKETGNKNEFDFNITGTFKNREDLLKFEDILGNSEIFLDLIIDLSNYNNKENNFRYGMTINMSS